MMNSTPDFYIEGIQTSEGLARFVGNITNYKKALLRFADNYDQIRSPELSDDYCRYIHTIKGTAANLGMMTLADSARELEKHLKEGVINDIAYQHLASELATLTKRIHNEVSVQTQSKQPVRKGTQEEYMTYIISLKEALDMSNPSESETILEQLDCTDWEDAGIQKPDLTPVHEALELYDFDRALATLESLITERT